MMGIHTRPMHSAESSPRSRSPHLSQLFTYSQVHRASSHTRTVSAAGTRPFPPTYSLSAGLYVQGRPASGGRGRRDRVDKAVRSEADIL